MNPGNTWSSRVKSNVWKRPSRKSRFWQTKEFSSITLECRKHWKMYILLRKPDPRILYPDKYYSVVRENEHIFNMQKLKNNQTSIRMPWGKYLRTNRINDNWSKQPSQYRENKELVKPPSPHCLTFPASLLFFMYICLCM